MTSRGSNKRPRAPEKADEHTQEEPESHGDDTKFVFLLRGGVHVNHERTFNTTLRDARLSGLVRRTIEGDGTTNTIDLRDSTVDTFRRNPHIFTYVVDFLKHYHGDLAKATDSSVEAPLRSINLGLSTRNFRLGWKGGWADTSWETNFINHIARAEDRPIEASPYQDLFDLCVVANYLEIPSLLSWAAAKLAAFVRVFVYDSEGPLSNLPRHFSKVRTEMFQGESYEHRSGLQWRPSDRAVGVQGLCAAGGREFDANLAEIVMDFAIVKERRYVAPMRNPPPGYPIDSPRATVKILWNGRVEASAWAMASSEVKESDAVYPFTRLANIDTLFQIQSHFVATTSGGALVVWGMEPPDQTRFRNENAHLVQQRVRKLCVTWDQQATAVLLQNERVVVWGTPSLHYGIIPHQPQDNTAVLLQDGVDDLCAIRNGFAALRKNGQVVVWGGNTGCSSVRDQKTHQVLGGVKGLCATSETVFARKDDDGFIIRIRIIPRPDSDTDSDETDDEDKPAEAIDVVGVLCRLHTETVHMVDMCATHSRAMVLMNNGTVDMVHDELHGKQRRSGSERSMCTRLGTFTNIQNICATGDCFALLGTDHVLWIYAAISLCTERDTKRDREQFGLKSTHMNVTSVVAHGHRFTITFLSGRVLEVDDDDLVST